MRTFIFLLFSLLFSPAVAQLKLEVTNPTADFRHEVVAVSADSVKDRVGDTFRVLDAAGLDVPYQLTHDRQLLVEVAVRAGGMARFSIVSGQPPQFPVVCHGALHPERKDDLAWENDRGCYRVYGPALQKTGERSFGVDVWVKNTPELVVDDRYYIEDVVTIPHIDTLYRNNWPKRDSIYRTISYHYDHGRGLDPYKVGASLGCGAPALLSSEGGIMFPYCFAAYQVLDDGPLRFTVHLIYNKVRVGEDEVTEHRIIQLDKQSNFNRCTVWYEGLRHQVSLCSGVVIQKEAPDPVVLGANYVSYTDPTDQPNVHQAPLYVAVLFPDGQVTTRQQQGHALCVVDGYEGRPYTYYFGSAWSKYDVRTPREWQARIDWYLASLATPLTCELYVGR